MAPAIRDVCEFTPARTNIFPRANTHGQEALPLHGRHPTRPIPRCSANSGNTWSLAPPTPLWEHLSCTSFAQNPLLQQARPHQLSHSPIRVAELCSGLATSLEALLKAGYTIGHYACVDTDPHAHIAASQRAMFLKHRFPHLLP